jgi:tRNA (Thr-GGU) A37 N-methylase
MSPIGIQDVHLLKVEGTTLTVEGLDAIDGTPVLDIKMCWHRE